MQQYAANAKPPATTSVSRMLWPLLRPHRWLLLLGIVLNGIHGVAISLQTIIPKYVIDDVVLAEQLPQRHRIWRLAGLVGLFLFASIIGRMWMWHLSFRAFASVREKVIFALREQFFRHVNHLCLRFHRQRHSGELFSFLFGSPLAQVAGYYNHFATAVPGAVLTLVWTLVWVAFWDWAMTLILLLGVVVTVTLITLVQGRVRALHQDYQTVETEVSGYVADWLRGTRDVKLYAIEDQVARQFARQVWRVGQRVYERDVQTHMQTMKHEGSGYVLFAMVLSVGVIRYWQNAITLGEFQAYLTAFLTLQYPLGTLFSFYMDRGGAIVSLRRINDVMQTDSTTPDPVGYEAHCPQRGDVRIIEVGFNYDHNPVLADINLTIPFGQHVAVVGPSGAGKTTLMQLLMRMYDPTSGVIRIGGMNILHCRGSELRSRFAVVPQDPFLFRATLRENLLVANPEADDALIESACRRANAWEFIERLPAGLDTPVGEGGSTLSGGQKQRLAIARALMRDCGFFIFDEATSALDTVSERMIQNAIQQAWQDRTAIVIAHRLATVRNCDRIIVLEHGRVVQDGKYDELINAEGLFRRMVQTQSLMT